MGNVLDNRDYAAHNLRSYTQQLPLQIDLTIRYTNQLKPDSGGIVPYSILPDNRSFSCFSSCNGWNYSSDAGPSIIQHVTGSSSKITPYRLPVPSTLVQVSTATPLASCVTILSPPRLQTSTLLSPIRSMTTPSTPPPLTDVTNLPVAFTLKCIQGTTIRSCYGCGGAIRLRTATVPPPPHDLVTRHK